MTKRCLLALLLSILMASTADSSTAAAPTKSKKLVVLDAGHGGHDRGASQDGVFESEIALKITKLVGQNLESAGHKVLYTRTKDEWLSLEKRAAIANQARGDLFVSIHLNSSEDPRAKGKEFYFQNQVPVDEEALFLANRENAGPENPTDGQHDQASHVAKHEKASEGAAEITLTEADRTQASGLRQAEAARIPEITFEDPRVRRDLKNILEDLDRSARVRASSELAVELFEEWKATEPAVRSSSRAIRQAPFFLVSHVAMPSVLVEVGFLSHKREGEKLNQAAYQERLASAISEGIRKNLTKNGGKKSEDRAALP
jgi:N-acetylmuramoyl-L-alanine amidase